MSALGEFVVPLLQLLLLPFVAVIGVLVHVFSTFFDLLFGRGKRLASPKSLVITGATAGIGEAFALHYAKPGVSLALTGRNIARLNEVAAACEARGAKVTKGNLDVTDREGMAKFLLAVDKATPVDCVIANAGISEGTMKLEREVEAATRALFATNVDGVFNTILPLLAPMKERRAGRIVLLSSLAATGPLPGSVAYSATKAAVRVYGEALRASVFRDGLRVNVICPGYVESDMTAANKSAMPGLMSMSAAMRCMTCGIARDTPVIQFPGALHTAFWALARVLPPGVMHAAARRRWLPGFLGYLRPRRGESRK